MHKAVFSSFLNEIGCAKLHRILHSYDTLGKRNLLILHSFYTGETFSSPGFFIIFAGDG